MLLNMQSTPVKNFLLSFLIILAAFAAGAYLGPSTPLPSVQNVVAPPDGATSGPTTTPARFESLRGLGPKQGDERG